MSSTAETDLADRHGKPVFYAASFPVRLVNPNEPAPYELYLAGVMPIAFLFGLRIPAALGPLLALLMLFVKRRHDRHDTNGRSEGYAALSRPVNFFLSLTALFFRAS